MFRFIAFNFLQSAAVTFSRCVGGLAAYNPLGGSVHAPFCIKVNEITQGADITAAGVLSRTQPYLAETVENRTSRAPLGFYITSMHMHLADFQNLHI